MLTLATVLYFSFNSFLAGRLYQYHNDKKATTVVAAVILALIGLPLEICMLLQTYKNNKL